MTKDPRISPASQSALICLAAALPATLLSFAVGNFLVDDAFISFRYAENLARGFGLVYNVGDRVEGYTNFLWVLLLAGVRVAGFDVPAASRVLGFLAALGALAATFRIGRALFPSQPPWVRFLPGLLLATNRSFWLWAVGGLETPLFTLLLLLGLLFRMDGERLRDDLLSALFLFAASLTRPEGVLVFGLLLVSRILFPKGAGRLGRVAPAAGLFGGLLALYLLWKWFYFGSLLPNTFFAKSVGETTLVRPGLVYVAGFVRDYGFGLGLLLAAAAIIVAPAGSDRRRTGLLAAVALVYLLYVAAVGGDIYYHYRFLMPVLPFLLTAALAGALGLEQRLAGRLRWPRGAAVVLLVGVQLAGVLLSEARFGGLLAHDRESNLFREQVAAVLREEYPANTVISTIGAGILPYRTGFANVDLAGLTNREIGRSEINRGAAGVVAHQKSSVGYVLSQRPDFVEFARFLTPMPALVRSSGYPLDFSRNAGVFYLGPPPLYPSHIDLMLSEEFHRHYRLTAFPLTDKESFMTFRRLPEGAIPAWEAAANLGWASFSRGDRARGLRLLLDAAAAAPGEPMPRLRLQQALSGAGQP